MMWMVNTKVDSDSRGGGGPDAALSVWVTQEQEDESH